MNLTPQIFLFWFSLVKVSGGWWWNSEEVNILKLTQTWLPTQFLYFQNFPSRHYILSFLFGRTQDLKPRIQQRLGGLRITTIMTTAWRGLERVMTITTTILMMISTSTSTTQRTDQVNDSWI